MDYKHNSALVKNARELRKNMTREERHLWYDFLRDFPVRFIRQKIIGNYIVDFYCPKAKLVIELDGSQHYENENIEKDRKRTEFLESYGIVVIRIANNELNRNFEGVCCYIENIAMQRMGRTIPQPPDGASSLCTREPEKKF